MYKKINNKSIIWNILYMSLYVFSFVLVVAFFYLDNYSEHVLDTGTFSCKEAYALLYIFSLVSFLVNILIENNRKIHIKSFAKIKMIVGKELDSKIKMKFLIVSCILSLSIIAGNYKIFVFFDESLLEKWLMLFLFVFSFTVIWYEFLKGVFVIFVWFSNYRTKTKTIEIKKSNKLFVIAWLSICFVYLAVLLFIMYPGNFIGDAQQQVTWIREQYKTNVYSYLHMIIISLFFWFGGFFSNQIEVMVFSYSVFMCIIMSACFALIVKKIYDYSALKFLPVITLFWFCLMPFHMLLTNTMFSDIPFTAFMILYVLTFLKIIKQNSRKHKWHLYFLLFVFSLGIGLLRSNGIFVLLIMLVGALVMWKILSQYVNMKVFLTLGISSIMVCSLFISSFTKDSIEQSSILGHCICVPAQQISRVIVECDDLSQEEEALINNIWSLQTIKDLYLPWSFDPLKFYVALTDRNRFSLILEKPYDYIRLYINLGIKHPVQYAAAWSDLIRTYFVPHLNFIFYPSPNFIPRDTYFHNNIFGSENELFTHIYSAWYNYGGFFDEYINISQSMGFYFWLLVISFVMITIKNNKALMYAYVPVFSVLVTVFLAVPCPHEFRYVYPMICLVPVYLAICLSCNAAYKVKESKYKSNAE